MTLDDINGESAIQLYSTDYILSKLNRERLDYISFRFQAAPGNGFNKIEFMMMMVEIIPFHPL